MVINSYIWSKLVQNHIKEVFVEQPQLHRVGCLWVLRDVLGQVGTFWRRFGTFWDVFFFCFFCFFNILLCFGIFCDKLQRIFMF